MRTLVLSLTVVTMLAGCASAPLQAANANAPNAASALPANATLPWRSAGTIWLKPESSQAPGKVEMPFTVNATGATVTATLHVGERYGPAELPASTSTEDAQLVDASGAVLAKAMRGAGGNADMKLEGKNAAPGAGKLVLTYRGGSDEGQSGGFGDYVTFTIDAK